MKLHGLSRFDALVKFHCDKPAKNYLTPSGDC